MASEPVDTVTPIVRKRRRAGSTDDHWLRRQSIGIAAQLPENKEDALAVLRYAQELVTGFIFAETA
jgi:hypothetical protein